MPQFNLDWIQILTTDITTNSSTKSFTVPAGKFWQIQSLYCTLVSNATVGNRQMAVDIISGSTVIARFTAGAVQAASVTRNYMFAPHVSDLTAFRDTAYLSTPLAELVLPQNFIIKAYDKTAVDAAGTAENLLAYLMVKQYG